MKTWDEIVNKALLGSEKAPLTPADIPVEIVNEFEVPNTADKEEDFLKISALAYQFRQAGARPINYSSVIQAEAPTEVHAYCSLKSNSILKGLLQEDVPQLLRFWLQRCAAKHQLAHPEVVPALLDIGQRKKELRQLIIAAVGKRGQWLGGFNSAWNFFNADADPKTIWDNGEPEARKQLLRELRASDPDQARQLLETTWATESANEKIAFLEILRGNLSASDLPWLEGLKEKGLKVNNAILELLKSIPSSGIVQEYQTVLAKAISIKTGKALLGMINKTELVVNESISIPESIFRTGVEKLSSDKKVSDNQYILIQLMTAVPPSFWNQHLRKSAVEIVELIQKERQSALYLPALAIASARFKEFEWIKTILDKADKDIISSSVTTLLASLPSNARNRYALEFLREQPDEVIKLMMTGDEEWSSDLARAVLKHTAREVYQYNRQFYKASVALIPVTFVNQLDSFTPDEEQRKAYWKNQRDELARLLFIKEQTLQSFNA